MRLKIEKFIGVRLSGGSRLLVMEEERMSECELTCSMTEVGSCRVTSDAVSELIIVGYAAHVGSRLCTS